MANSPLETNFLKLLTNYRPCITSPQKDQWHYMVREYRYYRFRFDFAWPNLKIAVEIQSKKWHRTPLQLERDRWKSNVAQSNGWIVFQFSGSLISRKPMIVLGMLRKTIEWRQNA